MHIKKTWATGYGTLLLDAPSGTQYSGMVCSNNGTAQGFVYWDNTNSLFDLYSNSGMAFFAGASERMRIDSSGNVIIKNSLGSPGVGEFRIMMDTGDTAMGIRTTVNGQNAASFVNAAGTAVGSITINSGGTAFNTTSDYRLKENIAPMTGALETVAQLKPVTYDWISDKSKGQGFIAHELQEVISDCVTGSKDAVDAEGNPVYQQIDTSYLVATLTAAIQEQQALITSLTARITALEGAK
jgi:hypothetical protein